MERPVGSWYGEESRGVILYATDGSVLEGRMDDAGGNVRFADLAAPPRLHAGLNDLGLAGTVDWVCSGYRDPFE